MDINQCYLSELPYRVIVWDLETTGLNHYHDNIIEIAAKDNQGNSFHTLVSYSGKLSPKIVELTGITDLMLIDKPTIKESLEEFVTFIKKSPVKFMIGHNSTKFDVLFLKKQMVSLGLSPLDESMCHLDTLSMAQYLLPDQKYYYSLKSLCYTFRINQQNSHRAMGDVNATQDLANQLIHLVMKGKNKEKLEHTINKLYRTINFFN